MRNVFDGSRILVTGACGTVGAELVQQLLNPRFKIKELLALDNNESELFFLEQRYLTDSRLKCYLGDIRDLSKLTQMMMGVDVVFHAAAFKHVILCERSPFEAVQTNIVGVQNVIQAAFSCDVERVIFTSSDKAVNPTSVMGTSKLMGEKLITAANVNAAGRKPIFVSTRFGNVLGSRGSVIPVFANQIRKGGPLTLTSHEMSRFIMSIVQAVRLVIDSAMQARGGEVFITKMPVIRIADLAHVMIEKLAPMFGYEAKDIEIVTIGAKPGEKLYEELMSDEETRRALELPKYFSVLPAFRGVYRAIDYDYADLLSETVQNPYVSSNESYLTREEIGTFLEDNNLLIFEESTSDRNPDHRYWPGEKA